MYEVIEGMFIKYVDGMKFGKRTNILYVRIRIEIIKKNFVSL